MGNDVQGEVTALHTILNANLQREDDFDDAVIAAKDVLKLYRGKDRKTDGEDKRGVALGLHSLSQVYFQRYMLSDALEAAEEALRFYEEVGEKKRGMVPVLHTMAGVQQALLKHDDAVKHMKQAVVISREVDDRVGEANALHCLAYLQMEGLFLELEKSPEVFSESHNATLE